MTSLIESYEQQYSVLTAEITANIGKLKVGNQEERDDLITEIQSNFTDAQDLLEQLELEVGGSRQSHLNSRVACYRAELERIKKDFIACKVSDGRSSYVDVDETYDDWSGVQEQQRKLLDNSERIERTGKTLNEGFKVILETEQIGAEVLRDLSTQRETIQSARNRLRETDEHLNRSSRLMNSMIMRSLQERFALVVFFIIFGILICVGIYFYIS